MIAFMLDAHTSTSYAAEKCVASDRDGITKFDHDLFNEQLDLFVSEYEETHGEPITDSILEQIADIRRNYEEYDAMSAMYESGFWDCDLPCCRTYTFRFLWCLHAIGAVCKWIVDRR